MSKLVLLVALIAAAAFGLWRALQPVTHGFDASAFDAGPHDTLDVGKVVSPIGGVPAGRPPNVVVILADDLGWGDLGVQGNHVLATPNIDQLAAEGVRLTGFYASAAVCTPSRAGLLTGRWPIRTGLTQVVFPEGHPNDRVQRATGPTAPPSPTRCSRANSSATRKATSRGL